MDYRLRAESPEFEMVDGPHEGRKYQHGMTYRPGDIPPGYESRFESLPALEPAPAARGKAAKAGADDDKGGTFE